MVIHKLEHKGKVYLEIDTSDIENREFLINQGVDITEFEQAYLDKKAQEDDLNFADYNGLLISLTSEDSNGLLQVDYALKHGLDSTYFRFSNGAIISLDSLNFEELTTFFVQKRARKFAV